MPRCASEVRGVSITYNILDYLYNLNEKWWTEIVEVEIAILGNEDADRLAKAATAYINYSERYSCFLEFRRKLQYTEFL